MSRSVLPFEGVEADAFCETIRSIREQAEIAAEKLHFARLRFQMLGSGVPVANRDERGILDPAGKLTSAGEVMLWDMLSQGLNQAEVGRRLGVSRAAVSARVKLNRRSGAKDGSGSN